MLVNRTASRVVNEPFLNAMPVETTQALQACHRVANLKFLEADGAFGIVDAILFSGLVGKHPGPTGWNGGN